MPLVRRGSESSVMPRSSTFVLKAWMPSSTSSGLRPFSATTSCQSRKPLRTSMAAVWASASGSTQANSGGPHSTGTYGSSITPASQAASHHHSQIGCSAIWISICHWIVPTSRRNSTRPPRIEEKFTSDRSPDTSSAGMRQPAAISCRRFVLYSP